MASEGFCGSVGNTPLIRIPSLSKITGCDIYGKAEFMNPGGSIKDRAALWMINDAMAKGTLAEGGLIVEATAGNTGVGLAHVCKAKNIRCMFVCPDLVSDEKVQQLKLLGAEDVIRVERLPATDPGNYQNVAKRLAAELNGVCLDQYYNTSNMTAHIESTGPEIWDQTNGQIDGLVLAPGTGGTIAGCSTFLKSKKSTVRVCLLDIQGSGVTLYSRTPHEDSRLKVENRLYSTSLREKFEEELTQHKTVMEGIGSNILFGNLSHALVDQTIEITDKSGIQMCHYLLKKEGLFVGGSAGINCCGAYLLAKQLGPGHKIVTFLCDGGSRYASKIYNEFWLNENHFDVSKATLEHPDNFFM